MKRLSFIALLLCAVVSMNAQHQINSFFDPKGAVRLETQELDSASGALASVFHRADDVVWSRVVYRIIDMRYKQNYQLYFPTNSDDPQYRSLFKVMLDAIVDGMEVYEKAGDGVDIKPHFEFGPMPKTQVPQFVQVDKNSIGEDIATSENYLINYDSIEDKMTLNTYNYQPYVRNQLKFMIQEVVFFDKHYSRLFTKIIAIAPMNSADINGEEIPIMDALNQSIRFWVIYDDFRPYMARQYVIPQANDTRRVTFEQFFAQKLYASYLIGESNMFSRMFAEYAERTQPFNTASAEEEVSEEEDEEVDEESTDEEEEVAEESGEETEDLAAKERRRKIEFELKREQQRVQDELMNFEIDLWEY